MTLLTRFHCAPAPWCGHGVPIDAGKAVGREPRIRRTAGRVVLAGAALLAAAPLATLAQGSSSALFAVGEGSVRPRPATQAVAPPKSQPKAATAAAAPKVAESKPPPSKVVKRKTPNRSVRTAKSPIALNGRWHDSHCIPLTGVTRHPPLYIKREYEFNDNRKAWKLDAAVYTSDACVSNTRMLTYHGEGTFAVTGKSRVASNAYDASFKIDRWSATPDTREGVLSLLNGRCGSGDFAQGRPLDLSATGCPTLGIRPIAQSPLEVELVSVSNGKFFLGSRSFVPGLSDDRPAQLSSYGLVRTP
jgi:hypothetical protein